MKICKSVRRTLLKTTLCLSLVLLCFYVNGYVQPTRVLIVEWGGRYLYNLQNDGKLEVFAIENLTFEGMVSLEIDDFPNYSLVSSRTLSFKEKMVVNQLITDVKNNSDSNYQANVEDASMIFARIDETFYETTYYDEWPDGNVNLRTLTHKLVEFSSIT